MSSRFRPETSIFLATLAVSSSLIITFPVRSQVPANETVIYVNPVTGTDTSGGGTSTAPYKTITYASSVAERSGGIIQLASGTYNSNSGETFPILLKTGVTLRGDESSKGNGVFISGGGNYLSRTFAKQNITILADNGSTITGITVTNPNQRGTGIWVESTNPTIANNTFTNNFREGVFVTGTANPKVINNVFVENQGNGISIAKSSQGEIRNNLFQNTGFGLAIGGTSTPSILENQIVQNKDGIVIADSAKPILRNNTIQNNKRDGIVLIDSASPDLGTSGNPGGNSINRNNRYNINNTTKKNTISSIGNNLDASRIVGAVITDNIQRVNPPQSNNSSSPDPNIALLEKWELTSISCDSGSQVVTIIMRGNKYCVMPHPSLKAKSYEYNQKTGTLKALTNVPKNPSQTGKGGL